MSDAGEDLAYLAAKLARLEADLAEARAALREIDSTTVPSGFLRVWRERHPAALKAAREAK